MEYLSCLITVVFLVHHLQKHFNYSHPDPQNAPFTITVMCPLKDNLNIVNKVRNKGRLCPVRKMELPRLMTTLNTLLPIIFNYSVQRVLEYAITQLQQIVGGKADYKIIHRNAGTEVEDLETRHYERCCSSTLCHLTAIDKNFSFCVYPSGELLSRIFLY